MMIERFLPDFRGLVRNKQFNPETNEHPVLYFEDDNSIIFYKPISAVIYTVTLQKEMLPDKISVPVLKQEFSAIQIPKKIVNEISIKIIAG